MLLAMVHLTEMGPLRLVWPLLAPSWPLWPISGPLRTYRVPLPVWPTLSSTLRVTKSSRSLEAVRFGASVCSWYSRFVMPPPPLGMEHGADLALVEPHRPKPLGRVEVLHERHSQPSAPNFKLRLR